MLKIPFTPWRVRCYRVHKDARRFGYKFEVAEYAQIHTFDLWYFQIEANDWI